MVYCSRSCSGRDLPEDESKRRRLAKRLREKIKHRKRLRSATVETVDPIKVFERDGWVCHLCGRRTLKTKRGTNHPRAPELDHIIPLSLGGAHSYANTACSCGKCNRDKAATIKGQPSLLSWSTAGVARG